jgi:sugar phosphate isomerase/epimerase
MTKHWIDNSVILGAPCIRVFAGPIPKDCTEEQAFNWAVECLREVAAYGEQKGVVVALENHGGITSTAEQVLKLLGAVNSGWMGVNLDFGNFRQDPYAEFEACAPYAVTTHAKTHYSGADGPIPVDYARVADIMRNAGYKGYITIEYEGKEEARQAVPPFAAQLLAAVRTV